MCQTAIVHGRETNGRVLSFGHAGKLYRKSFVMYDRATGSEWLHVTGEALAGPLKGTQLEFLPTEVVAWSDWRERHPETLVLDGEHASKFMGGFRLRGRSKQFGLSVGEGRDVTLFRYPLLDEHGVWNDALVFAARDAEGGENTGADPQPREEPIVVAFDPDSLAAGAFERTVGGEVLRFEALEPGSFTGERAGAESAYLRDLGTGSLWGRAFGECVEGPLRGRRLRRMPATPWLVERWEGFFPGGRIVE